MIIGSYDLDIIEEAFDAALKIDLTFKTLVNAKTWCSKCEGYRHYDYQCPSKSQYVSTVSSDDIDNSKVVEDVHAPKTVNIIEDILVGYDTPIIKGHASYEGTSEVVLAVIESSTPLNVDAHAHDISESAPEFAEFNVCSQISRYSFVKPLIEDDIEHETIDSSIFTSNGPFESPRADYDFMVVTIDSFSSELFEFLVMIQQIIFSAFSSSFLFEVCV